LAQEGFVIVIVYKRGRGNEHTTLRDEIRVAKPKITRIEKMNNEDGWTKRDGISPMSIRDMEKDVSES